MRRAASGLILAALLIVASAVVVFSQNPLVPPAGGENSELRSREQTQSAAEQLGAAGTFSRQRPVSAAIRRWSNSLQQSIASLSRRVREEGNLPAAFAAFGLAVLFGAVHIAGPGHGKVFALSYFASRESKWTSGIVYSVIVNIVDSLSAFLVVLAGYVLLRAVTPAFRLQAPVVLEIVSYSLIIVFGLVHLASHATHRHRHHDHDPHDHEPHVAGDRGSRPHHGGHHHPVKTAARNPWALALTVGLIPCPVSTVLLVYGVVNGVLPLMVLMVVGVSVGGFLTMTAISLTVIAGRKRLMAMLSTGTGATVATVLEFVASGSIIVIGGLLLIAAIG